MGATVVTEARGSPAVRKQAVDRTHLRRRSGENSGAVEVRGRGQRLGELLGLEVELLCGSGEAAARRSDGISAARWFYSGAEGAAWRWDAEGTAVWRG